MASHFRETALESPSGSEEKEQFAQIEDTGKHHHLAGDIHVRDSLLAEALRESDIKRWSKTSIHLYWAIFIGFLCSCANGYDGSLFSGILSMPYFQATFKSGTDGPTVSVIASLYTVGQMVGALPAAVITDRYGRRKAMASGAMVIILGTIVSGTANHVAQFIVGRFILGFGITIMSVAAPAYAMEVAPPQWRGRCTGLLNCGWFGGSIPAAAVTYGTNYIQSDYSWRIPVILQGFTCIIVIFSIWFIPESPRWQMARGREGEAYAFLVKYHGNGNANSKLVALEIEEFREHIALDGADKRWWDYRPLFKTRNSRWRILQVILMNVTGQFSGNGLGYFNTVVYAKLGITSVIQQLQYNLVYAVISAAGAVIGACFSDRMPRRWPLVYGTLVCAGWLMINAALQQTMHKQGPDFDPVLGKAALASYFLFSFSFMFSYTPLQTVVPVESLETTMRAKGLGLGSIISGSMGFLNQFCGPIALKNIGYNYIWFFAAWDVVEAGLWYFLGVEGQGRTLEELNAIYDSPNPVKASRGIKTKRDVNA